MEETRPTDTALEGDRPIGRSPSRHERGKQTRRNLIRTAARLWSDRGFDAVTVEDICTTAGVGRTTFYLHFESKEQLLTGLAGATAAGVASDLQQLGPGAGLDDLVGVFITGVARRMEAVPKSLAELVIRSQRAQVMKARAEGHPTRFADLLRHILAGAQRAGELVAPADTAELGEILGALTMDAIEAWASVAADARPLEAVLRSRFALIVDQFRSERS